MMDLAKLDVLEACNNPVETELKHPATERGIGSFVSILGCESTEMRKHERLIADEKIAEMRSGKVKRTPDEGVQRIINVALAATVGWRNVKHKGKKLEFTKENAKMLFNVPGLDWIPVQIYKEVQMLALFMKG